jgi:prophage regulatory protein
MLKTRGGDIVGTQTDALQFIRLPEVRRLTGLSKSTVYRLIDQDRFPRPVPLGLRTVGWVQHEVVEWQRQRVALRDNNSEAA